MDGAGRRWVVKFGSEAHTDTFQSRFVSALGYAAEPTYFVAAGSIQEVHDLKRAKYFIAKDGSFRDARFKLRGSEVRRGHPSNPDWSWADNPFVGSRELGGLKILVMLTSNWDTKDARNGKDESNTGMIRPVKGEGLRLVCGNGLGRVIWQGRLLIEARPLGLGGVSLGNPKIRSFEPRWKPPLAV